MCRWLAYSGPPVLLSTLLTRPNHSLIDQSRRARENVVTTNGDGFGVGWYGTGTCPGMFHNTHPAWNDVNLRHLSAHIRSPLFLAHVRAATGTAIQETNCHPFAYENWLFQHNGVVPEFHRLKRQLQFDIEPNLFPSLQGSTDSETLFYLGLTLGMSRDPQQGLERMVGHLETLRQQAGIESPVRFSAALADGNRLFAVRYSSGHDSPTLYHSRHAHALRVLHDSYETLPDGAVVVLSEPLDDMTEHWAEVPESSFVTVEQGHVTIEPFVPTAS